MDIIGLIITVFNYNKNIVLLFSKKDKNNQNF